MGLTSFSYSAPCLQVGESEADIFTFSIRVV